MTIVSSWGHRVLALYLILVGLSGLIPAAIPGILLALLALVAGILILIGR